MEKTKDQHGRTVEDDFLILEEHLGLKQDAAKRHLKQAMMEINELKNDKKWMSQNGFDIIFMYQYKIDLFCLAADCAYTWKLHLEKAINEETGGQYGI